MNKPPRNSAYNQRASFASRKKSQDKSAYHLLPYERGLPPGGTYECGKCHDLELVQEYTFATAPGLMQSTGFQGTHSNTDEIPIRNMATDGIFDLRPDRGTVYDLGTQLNPAYALHPLSTLAYNPKIERDGNYDPEQRPFMIDTYHTGNERGDDEFF